LATWKTHKKQMLFKKAHALFAFLPPGLRVSLAREKLSKKYKKQMLF